jgi:hypothetical protein
VLHMHLTFAHASAFNRNLAKWNIAGVANMRVRVARCISYFRTMMLHVAPCTRCMLHVEFWMLCCRAPSTRRRPLTSPSAAGTRRG